MPSRRELANAIRALSMDAVQRANSGHPGMPMGMADIAEVLWRDFLKHNPGNPRWADRDRFVLSNGHGSMLLYSLLHLTGYPLSLDELRQFRQLGSRTAGHPEHEIGIGIETTTGPLGQGLANAVGMALAEKMLAADFNRPGHWTAAPTLMNSWRPSGSIAGSRRRRSTTTRTPSGRGREAPRLGVVHRRRGRRGLQTLPQDAAHAGPLVDLPVGHGCHGDLLAIVETIPQATT